jgi:hypothetical protein
MFVVRLGLVLIVLLLGSRFSSVAQLSPSLSATQQIRLGWLPSPSPEASGYYVCWGLASGQCTNRMDAGNVTETGVGGMEPGVAYFFTVVAYSDLGDEAPPSNEVSTTIPVPTPQLRALLSSSGSQGPALQLSFPAEAGTTYEIQASTDFNSWQPIWTNSPSVGGEVQFTVSDLSQYPQRFFKVVEK